jgi:hypothetical protein
MLGFVVLLIDLQAIAAFIPKSDGQTTLMTIYIVIKVQLGVGSMFSH